MERRFDTISFLSDFGTVDEFVGVVKAVVRDLAPHVTIIDLTHEIAPFDVRAGALTLARCISYVPAGIVLAIVDPGVGTDRRAVAVEVADGAGIVLGPDNGLLGPAVALTGGAGRAVVLTNDEYHLASPGATFAGRDVFAPVAAHLCNGADLADLGESIDPVLLLPSVIPLPRIEESSIVCEALWIDRFGNVQLNVGPDDLSGAWGPDWGDRVRVRFGDHVRSMVVVPSFGAIPPGAPGLVVDSYGMLAIALDRFSAATELDLGPTDQVVLELAPDDTGITSPVTLRIDR
jgi:S-adenosyl-L-methionine hydrolase (adenosine-forming)